MPPIRLSTLSPSAVCETGRYRDADSQLCESCPPGMELPESTFFNLPFLVLYAVVAVIIAKLIAEIANRYCVKLFDWNKGESLYCFNRISFDSVQRQRDAHRPKRSCSPDGKVDRNDCIACVDRTICPGFKD